MTWILHICGGYSSPYKMMSHLQIPNFKTQRQPAWMVGWWLLPCCQPWKHLWAGGSGCERWRGVLWDNTVPLSSPILFTAGVVELLGSHYTQYWDWAGQRFPMQAPTCSVRVVRSAPVIWRRTNEPSIRLSGPFYALKKVDDAMKLKNILYLP